MDFLGGKKKKEIERKGQHVSFILSVTVQNLVNQISKGFQWIRKNFSEPHFQIQRTQRFHFNAKVYIFYLTTFDPDWLAPAPALLDLWP